MGNLPPGCTQGDIDRALGGCSPDWVCGDPECKTGWAGEIETWPCDVEGCDVIGCPDCRCVCFACDRAICSKHRQKADVGDGQRFYCKPCISDAKENAA